MDCKFKPNSNRLNIYILNIQLKRSSNRTFSKKNRIKKMEHTMDVQEKLGFGSKGY